MAAPNEKTAGARASATGRRDEETEQGSRSSTCRIPGEAARVLACILAATFVLAGWLFVVAAVAVVLV